MPLVFPINVAISRQARQGSQHEPVLADKVCVYHIRECATHTAFRASYVICRSSCNGTELNISMPHVREGSKV